ncbi:MAG: glutathione S-transferase [Drouetiella hepatica Uher 2000/2452]|jgi:glutathione S-transferase|uniref:Glutathione S-transferase n=1 Tax=Drouetiella hepatica Uher 2000/2452 TaxID=904376 RepID=A0A951QC24_9CYAN|nr:glutathione S-transferase [Drouetiella hepatica Uher 2000/2452]
MLLLQFSTSHYCRKARLALGYKQISYRVENLTPGLHILKVKPLSGLTTLPVLLPEQSDLPPVIADSTQIFHFLDSYCPAPNLAIADPQLNSEVWALEDWLDESIGIAARFVYYAFRAGEGKAIDASLSNQLIIQTVRWQYGITAERVKLAASRLEVALTFLAFRWQEGKYLVGDRLTAADLAAAALLSPLALIPLYRQNYPWLFDRIAQIHRLCGEPLPPGLEEG